MELTDAEMVAAAKKILKTLWPSQTGIDQDQFYTPYFVAYCLEIGAHAVGTTAKIKYFQVLWQAGANPSKFRELVTLRGLINLLKDAAKEGVKAVAKGEISVVARAGYQYHFTHDIRIYFSMGGGKDNYPSWPKLL